MRAAAIIHPRNSLGVLRHFRRPGVDLVIAPDLRPDDRFDAALVFGGDGSIHRQLRNAVESQTPLLCVPGGSGNDFARALGLGTLRQAIAAWDRFRAGSARVRAIDLAEVTPLEGAAKLYCCVAGAGLDSEVNRRANEMPAWLRGHGGYALALLPALRSFRPQTITLELWDAGGKSERISTPAMMVAFANAPSYGHGMRIAPEAKLDDGLLDVCFVRQTGRLRLLRLFPRVYFGAHLHLPEVQYRRAARLRLDSEAPMDIYGDGERLCSTPAEVRIMPGALRVIAP